MLIQSSLPISVEEEIAFVSDDRRQHLLCEWIPISTTRTKDICADSSCLDHTPSFYKFSSISNMCASSPNLVYERRKLQRNSVAISNMCTSSPNLVYKRRKLQRNSVAFLSPQESSATERDAECLSKLNSKACSVGQMKNKPDSAGVSGVLTDIFNSDIICNGIASTCGQMYHHNLDNVSCTKIKKAKDVEFVSRPESIDGYSEGEEQQLVQYCRSASEYCNGNESFSSSKSNMEPGSASMKTDINDSGECSSSGFLLGRNISEKELCISILKSHGLLERASPIKSRDSIDGLGINGDDKCPQLCKMCGHMENPINMLICDSCEDAFHVSCCNPKIKKIPVNEWYCNPCSRKKHKFSPGSATEKSLKIMGEGSECRNRASKRGLSLIESMLKDSEPYTTDVRVGKGFQADVPEWSGPISEEYDCFGEPLEIDPTEYGSVCEENTNRLSKPIVGNWLQCREVLDDDTGEDDTGTICGKWRRAPLFEAQTDKWDCSCAVLWDPIHADCAVPQELETDQILMHLKYIQLLRPRLASNKRKQSPPKSDTEDVRTVTSKQGSDT
ncbi:Zinc finger protein [Thalictrum thalictroides]|uniref:Zinc finger protein n=1 Tax=Thalictrum thalictroides TaxID=46969 RepID=A0A7J6WXV1_THATH|nr:Zinc finger protein [Thalictrum thalictroides]